MRRCSLLEESGYPEAGVPIAALLSDPDERLQRAALYAELGLFLGTRIELRRQVALVVEVRDAQTGRRAHSTRPWASLPTRAGARRGGDSRCSARSVTRTSASRARGHLRARHARRSSTDARRRPAYRDVAEGLAERLGDPSPAARVAVARAAGRIFSRCAAPCEMSGLDRLGDALVHTLNDPDRRVRLAALDGVGDMRWGRSVQAVTAGYEYYQAKGDGMPYLATLARIGHPTAVPLLKSALPHRDSAFRLAGGEGLARLGGDDALAASAALIEDRVPAVKVVSAFAVARGRGRPRASTASSRPSTPSRPALRRGTT